MNFGKVDVLPFEKVKNHGIRKERRFMRIYNKI